MLYHKVIKKEQKMVVVKYWRRLVFSMENTNKRARTSTIVFIVFNHIFISFNQKGWRHLEERKKCMYGLWITLTWDILTQGYIGIKMKCYCFAGSSKTTLTITRLQGLLRRGGDLPTGLISLRLWAGPLGTVVSRGCLLFSPSSAHLLGREGLGAQWVNFSTSSGGKMPH